MRLTTEHLDISSSWTRDISARGGAGLRAAWVELDKLDGRPMPYKPIAASSPGDDRRPAKLELQAAPLGRLGVPILIDIGIDGFLHREEALQLYDLSLSAPGDALELGTHKGLSTTIICRALHDRGSGALETVDIDEAANEIARENVGSRPGGERVTFTLQDAAERLNTLRAEGRTYGFAFVDHWHGYEATYDAVIRLKDIIAPGGYVMFHDFFDPANIDPDHVYGVYQGVLDGLGAKPTLSFVGSAGGSAIFRKA